MAFKPIRSPRGAIIQGSNGRVQLIWNNGCAPGLNKVISLKQEKIDSEVLRLCAPMVPKRTGALELLEDGSAILIDPDLYDESTGLSLDVGEGKGYIL